MASYRVLSILCFAIGGAYVVVMLGMAAASVMLPVWVTTVAIMVTGGLGAAFRVKYREELHRDDS